VHENHLQNRKFPVSGCQKRNLEVIQSIFSEGAVLNEDSCPKLNFHTPGNPVCSTSLLKEIVNIDI